MLALSTRRITLLLILAPLSVQSQTTAPLTEVLEVRVTNVDVVVTDEKGQRVEGLTREDFELYENGKRQEITNFYEVGSSAQALTPSADAVPPTATATRKFVFYFDNGTLSVKNRNDIFPAARDFLKRVMRTGDQAMIVTWNRSLKVRQPWTHDLASVDRTLMTMAGENAESASIDAQRKRIERILREIVIDSTTSGSRVSWDEVEATVRAYAENVRHDVTQSTNAMTKLLSSLAGVDGKKVLVLATESLPTHAGRDMVEHLEQVRRQLMDLGGRTSLRARNQDVADLARFNLSPAITQLATVANATGVSIYALNPKPHGGGESGKVEEQWSVGANVEFATAVQGMDALNILARETGGVAMIGAPASLALARLEQDIEGYYSLGYRARPGSDPTRTIEVRTTRPGLRVRSRKQVHYRSVQTEMADRVTANHLQSNLRNELGIALRADAARASGRSRMVPLRIIIPVDRLTLLPEGENVSGGFSVFISTGDRAGDASGVNMQSHPIKWTRDAAEKMKGRAFGFAVEVPLEGKRDQISIGVVDHISQTTGFAVMKVVAAGG